MSVFTLQPPGDEPLRKMIQQLRMRWFLASRAEIIHRPHEPCTEEPVPDAVCGNARGQRIARVGDPPSEFAPPAFLGRKRRRFVRQCHTEKSAWHDVAGLLHLPADADPRIGDLFIIAHGHRGRALRSILRQCFQVRVDRFHALLRGAFPRRVRASVPGENRRGGVLLREKLESIDGDVTTGGIIRDEHVASAVFFKTKLPE